MGRHHCTGPVGSEASTSRSSNTDRIGSVFASPCVQSCRIRQSGLGRPIGGPERLQRLGPDPRAPRATFAACPPPSASGPARPGRFTTLSPAYGHGRSEVSRPVIEAQGALNGTPIWLLATSARPAARARAVGRHDVIWMKVEAPDEEIIWVVRGALTRALSGLVWQRRTASVWSWELATAGLARGRDGPPLQRESIPRPGTVCSRSGERGSATGHPRPAAAGGEPGGRTASECLPSGAEEPYRRDRRAQRPVLDEHASGF